MGIAGHDRLTVRRPAEGRRRVEARIRLDDSGTYIHFAGGVKMNVQTSTTSNTRWWLFGLIFIDNAYLTE